MTDLLSGLQMTVCLPKKSSKSSEYQYLQDPSTCPSSSCDSAHSTAIQFSTLKAFYSLSFFMSIRLYGTSNSHSLTISIRDANGTILSSSSQTIDVTNELALSETDADCNGCQFGQAIAEGSFALEAGGATGESL